MSDYTTVPTINQLYEEQALLKQALALVDDEGTVATIRVAPSDASMHPEALPVTVATIDPPESLMSEVRAAMVARYNAINQELHNLGVVNTPPDVPNMP